MNDKFSAMFDYEYFFLDRFGTYRDIDLIKIFKLLKIQIRYSAYQTSL